MTDFVVGCVFCDYVTGRGERPILMTNHAGLIIEPFNPVVPGHVLVISHRHLPDFMDLPLVAAGLTSLAVDYAKKTAPVYDSCNWITSRGKPATQSVFHLHHHLIPRHEGDGLHLPWTRS